MFFSIFHKTFVLTSIFEIDGSIDEVAVLEIAFESSLRIYPFPSTFWFTVFQSSSVGVLVFVGKETINWHSVSELALKDASVFISEFTFAMIFSRLIALPLIQDPVWPGDFICLLTHFIYFIL